LASVSKTHPGTKVALWAQKSQADMDLSSGLSALYTNRDEAYRLLDDARQAYNSVVDQASDDPELMVTALLGLANVSEATNNLDKARDYYQKLAQQFANTAEASQAASRLAALKSPEEQQFYRWFDKQKPLPPSPTLPNVPGMPDDLSRLPDKPDLPLFTPAGGGAGSAPPAEGPPTAAGKEPAPAAPAEPAAGPPEKSESAQPDAASSPSTSSVSPAAEPASPN
jgi:hypothetical protein